LCSALQIKQTPVAPLLSPAEPASMHTMHEYLELTSSPRSLVGWFSRLSAAALCIVLHCRTGEYSWPSLSTTFCVVMDQMCSFFLCSATFAMSILASWQRYRPVWSGASLGQTVLFSSQVNLLHLKRPSCFFFWAVTRASSLLE
jgi:hypothetical protein